MAPRILIARLSSIGDCIHTIPLAHALRDRWPDAYIAWLVERPTDQLLAHLNPLNNLIVLPKRWYKSPKRVRAIRRDLRKQQFDISLDPQSLTKSAALPWLAGIKRRIGFARPPGREAAPWLNNQRVTPSTTHVVDRYLETLRPLGIERPGVKFDLKEDAQAAQSMETFLRGAHLTGGYIVLNPGAGWDSRLWPPRRYGYVARRLGEHRQIPSVVVWAGQREQIWAEEIVAHSSGHAFLAPPTTLTQLATLLRRARMFLGSDTGPLHLAVAVGAPCVGLYGSTKAEVSGPYGQGNLTIQKHYQGGAGRKRRGAANDAMRAIEVDDVYPVCLQILDRQPAPTDVRAA